VSLVACILKPFSGILLSIILGSMFIMSVLELRSFLFFVGIEYNFCKTSMCFYFL